jgi:hypothetical protein
MKTKLLSLFTLCVFFIGCSVDPIEEELNTSAVSELETVDVTADYGCAGPDNSFEITVADAKAIKSWDEVRKLYLGMLAPGVSKRGTFNPTIWDIIKQFNQNSNPIGSYSTTYTVNTDSCSDSVILTLKVVEKLSVPCEVSAGADGSKTITLSEAEALGSWDAVRKLYLSMLESGVSPAGTFEPSINQLIKDYNSRSNKLGEYPTTYTVKDGDCSDSTILKMIIVENVVEEPVCTLDAGADGSKEITLSEAKALGSWDAVRKLYLGMLESGVSPAGTFSPSIDQLIKDYNSRSNKLGEYPTIYTVNDGDCSDSTELKMIIVEDKVEDPACTLDAGPDNMKELTVAQARALGSWDEVRKQYFSLLKPGVSKTGSFSPSIDAMIKSFNSKSDPVGDYTLTYTIKSGDCTDSVNLTLRVI